jgi:hypothetical protein
LGQEEIAKWPVFVGQQFEQSFGFFSFPYVGYDDYNEEPIFE